MPSPSRLLGALLALAASPSLSGVARAEEGHVTFAVPGQYAHRAQLMSELPLYAPRDGMPDTLDQQVFGYHWVRVTPTFNWSERFLVTGQLDLLRGTVWGDTAADVGGDTAGRDGYDGYSSIDPRWLFATYRTPGGLLVLDAGQMGSHWGLGMFANDGTRETFFGDPLYGDIVERVMVQGGPIPIPSLGAGLTLAAGADLVFADGIADVREGDTALQGVVAAVLTRRESTLGAYVVYRDQTSDLGDELRVGALDLFSTFEARLPGGRATDKVHLGVEGVLALGQSSLLRAVDRDTQDVLQGGLLVEVSAITRWFDLGLEAGWASGDADTLDGTATRFTFDPDHNVGMVLFDEVSSWQTARAAALAADPELSGRPARGVLQVPSRGGVSGAMYVFPTVRIKPAARLELRLGGIVAEASSDVVDPFRQKASGSARNHRGGRPQARDLGVEVDGGVRWQVPLSLVNLDLGLEGGVLLPGHAFDDERGEAMDPIAVGRLRAGLSW